MERAYAVAIYAHRFALLSRRPAYLQHDPAQRVEALIADLSSRSGFEIAQVKVATETDLMCGHAVRMLAKSADAAVLDLLAALSSDRVAGIFYALGPDRRGVILDASGEWALHVSGLDHQMPEAAQLVEALSDGPMLDSFSDETFDEMEQFTLDCLRGEADEPYPRSDLSRIFADPALRAEHDRRRAAMRAIEYDPDDPHALYRARSELRAWEAAHA